MSKDHVVCSRLTGKDFFHMEHIRDNDGIDVSKQIENHIKKERAECPICRERNKK